MVTLHKIVNCYRKKDFYTLKHLCEKERIDGDCGVACFEDLGDNHNDDDTLTLKDQDLIGVDGYGGVCDTYAGKDFVDGIDEAIGHMGSPILEKAFLSRRVK